MPDKYVLTAAINFSSTNIDKVAREVKKQISNISGVVDVKVSPRQQQAIRQLNNDIKKTNKELKSTGGNAKEAGFLIEGFGKSAALAIRRFGAFVTATFAVRGLIRSMKAATSEAIKFERELVKIAQVNDVNVKSLVGLSSEITRLSTRFGVSSAKLLQASRILSQTGLSADKVLVSLEALAKSDLAPTFEDIIKTTEGSIAIFRQFNIEAKDLEKTLGSINAVAGKFAVESADIIAAVRRTGGVFSAAGGQLNELIALFTSVRATTRESAESIATGFRTIFSRLQRARTVNFLETLGIQLKDAEGQFVGPFKAIERLSAALKGLSTTDLRFAQIVEELGGFRQVGKVIPLIKQFDTAQRALNVAERGGESLARDSAKAQQALAVELRKVREEFLKLIREFTDTKTFKVLINSVLSLARAFIQVAESIKPILPLVAILGSVGAGNVLTRFFRGNPRRNAPGFIDTLKTLQSGGSVKGSGSGDKIPALLEPGEFVLNRNAVKKIGASTLTKVNKGIGRFRSGGLVGMQAGGIAGAISRNPTTTLLGVAVLGQIIPALDKFGNTVNKTDNLLNKLSSSVSGAIFQFIAIAAASKLFRNTGASQAIRGVLGGSTASTRPNDNRKISLGSGAAFTRGIIDQGVGITSRIQAKRTSLRSEDRRRALGIRTFDERLEQINLNEQERIAKGIKSRNISLQSAPIAQSRIKEAAEKSKKVLEENIKNIDTELESLKEQPITKQNSRQIQNLLNRRKDEQLRVHTIEIDAQRKIAAESKKRTQFILDQNRFETQEAKKSRDLFSSVQGDKNNFIQASGKEQDRLRKEIAKERGERRRLARRAIIRRKIARGIEVGGQVGGVLALAGGEFLSGAGSRNIQAGRFETGRTQTVAGGALSSAGTGALIGSALGPLGIAIGAVTGGLLGLFSASKKASEEIARVKFAKSIEGFNKALEDLSRGRTTPNIAASEIQRGLVNIRGRIRTAQGSDLEQLQGQIRNSAPVLEKFFNDIANGVSTFDEFQAVVGKDTLRLFTTLNNDSLPKFREQIQKTIANRNKELKVNEQLIKANQNFNERVRAVVFLERGLKDATFAADRFSSVLDSISDPLSVTSGSNFSELFNRQGPVNQGLFDQAISRTVGLLGGGEGISSLGQQASLVNKALAELPNILLTLRQQPPIGDDAIVTRLEKSLNTSLGPQGKFITDLIISRVNKDLIGSESKENRFLESLQSDFTGTLEKIFAGFKDFSNIFGGASSQLEGAISRYSNLISKTVDIQSQLTETFDKRILIEEEQSRFLRSAFGITGTDFAGGQAFDLRRQQNILGQFSGLANNPRGIGAQAAQTEQNIIRLTALRDSTDKKDLAATQEIIKQLNNEQKNLNRLNKALQFLADTANRTANAQNKLREVQENRAALRNVATNAVFGNLSSRRQLARAITGAQFLGQGGNVNQVPADLLPEILNLLKSLGNNRLGALGGRTPEELIRDILIQQGIPRELAQVGASSEEQRLIKTITDSQNKGISALNNIALNLQDRDAKFIATLDKSLKTFTDNLANILLENEKRRFDKRISDVQTQINARQRTASSLQTLSGFGLTPKTSAEAAGLLPVPRLLTKRREDINRRTQLNQVAGNALLSDENIVKAISSRNFIGIEELVEKRLSEVGLGGRAIGISKQLKDILSTGSNLQARRASFTLSQEQAGKIELSDESRRKNLNIVFNAIEKIFTELSSKDISNINKSINETTKSLEKLGVVKFTLNEKDISNLKQAIELLSKLDTNKFVTDAQNLQNRLNDLKNKRTVLGKQHGGFIPGVGVGDIIPALLEPGEFVIRKKAVQNIGVGNLNRLNEGNLPKDIINKIIDSGTRGDFESLSRFDKSILNKFLKLKPSINEEIDILGGQSGVKAFLEQNQPKKSSFLKRLFGFQRGGIVSPRVRNILRHGIFEDFGDFGSPIKSKPDLRPRNKRGFAGEKLSKEEIEAFLKLKPSQLSSFGISEKERFISGGTKFNPAGKLFAEQFGIFKQSRFGNVDTTEAKIFNKVLKDFLKQAPTETILEGQANLKLDNSVHQFGSGRNEFKTRDLIESEILSRQGLAPKSSKLLRDNSPFPKSRQPRNRAERDKFRQTRSAGNRALEQIFGKTRQGDLSSISGASTGQLKQIAGLEGLGGTRFSQIAAAQARNELESRERSLRKQGARQNFRTGGPSQTISPSKPGFSSNTPVKPVVNSNNINNAGTGKQQAGQQTIKPGQSGLTGNIDGLVDAMNKFVANSDALTQALNNFPRQIEHKFTGSLEIIVNGAEVLTRIMPEVQSLVEAKVKDGINNLIKQRFPKVAPIDNNTINPPKKEE